jgi:hypothetical protein
MASKRKQLEEMLAGTKDNIVRMQLTNMLNEELQRQNGIVKRISGAIDSLLREMIGLFGKRSHRAKVQRRKNIKKSPQKQFTSNLPQKDRTEKQPDDLAEIIAIWPKLPEHVKAAISDILRVS